MSNLDGIPSLGEVAEERLAKIRSTLMELLNEVTELEKEVQHARGYTLGSSKTLVTPVCTHCEKHKKTWGLL